MLRDMSESLRKPFYSLFAHAGWLVVTIAGLALVLPMLLCRDGSGTAFSAIGRDMAWFTAFWGGVVLLLAGLGTPDDDSSLSALGTSRQAVYRRFGGVLGFWLAGVTCAGLSSALGLFLATNDFWRGFPLLIGGTLMLLLPLTALGTILERRVSAVSRGFLLVLWVALGSHLDLIRDGIDATGNTWWRTGFEVLALFIPDLSFPDWRGWLVFGHEPGAAVLLAALTASVGLTLFFLEVGVLLRERQVAGKTLEPAGGSPLAKLPMEEPPIPEPPVVNRP